MPKTEKSQSEKLKYFVRIFGKNVLETDGKILLCSRLLSLLFPTAFSLLTDH